MILYVPDWITWLLFSGVTFFVGFEFRKYQVMKSKGKQKEFWREWFD